MKAVNSKVVVIPIAVVFGPNSWVAHRRANNDLPATWCQLAVAALHDCELKRLSVPDADVNCSLREEV